MSASATTTAATSPRWLFGSATDWMLGCGGVYAIALAAQLGMGSDLQRWVPGGAMVLLFSLPHYGATLLRGYERREDRQRYWLFVAPITAVLALLFVAGLQWGLLGSLLLTVYLTWSPWHYSGQNYGVFLMLAGRRGVPASGTAKRLLWWSFMLSYALTILGMHGAQGGNYTPLTYEGTAFAMIPLGFSGPWVDVAIGVVGIAYACCLLGAVGLLLRGSGASLAALAPSLGVAAMQAAWFAVPVLARGLGPATPDSLLAGIYSGYGFLWIATAHAIQYLWVTLYYAVGSEPAVERARFLGKAALAGFAVWTVPGVLFAPGILGDLPYESGLAVLVAAMVNLHHFILDGALWKLRDGRVARVLLGARHDAVSEREGGRRVAWLRPAIWVTGAACGVLSLVSFWESEFGFGRSLERENLDRARAAVERIAWIGRDGPARHTKIGLLLAEEGRLDEARVSLERSLDLRPTSLAWQSLGMLEEKQERWEAATAAYGSALELAGDDVGTLYRFGLSAIEAGEAARAEQALARAVELAPANSRLRPALAKARRMTRSESAETDPGAEDS